MAMPSKSMGEAALFRINLNEIKLRQFARALGERPRATIEENLRVFTVKVAKLYNANMVKVIDSDSPPPGYTWPPLNARYAKSKGHWRRYIKSKILRKSWDYSERKKGNLFTVVAGIPSDKTYPNGLPVWEVMKALDEGSDKVWGKRARNPIPPRPIMGGVWDITVESSKKTFREHAQHVFEELRQGFYN
jgi:hypothetical protein